MAKIYKIDFQSHPPTTTPLNKYWRINFWWIKCNLLNSLIISLSKLPFRQYYSLRSFLLHLLFNYCFSGVFCSHWEWLWFNIIELKQCHQPNLGMASWFQSFVRHIESFCDSWHLSLNTFYFYYWRYLRVYKLFCWSWRMLV